MRLLIAGEGRTELGEWAKAPEYREPRGEKGVLVALLDRVAAGDALEIMDGIPWRCIRKYAAGAHASAEERNVLGLALRARDAGCEVVVFARDRDGDVERERAVARGIERAGTLFVNLKVVGGVARENLEGWILVLLGDDGESVSPARTKSALEARGIGTLGEKVAAIRAASLEGLRPGSLTAWLGAARAVLPPL